MNYFSLFVLAAVISSCFCESQRSALEQLYKNTNGINWKNNDGWLQNADYCTWYGVLCTPYTRLVGEIHLPNNNLSGHLSSSLVGLHALKVLDLTNNNLSGAIPNHLGQLVNLRLLNLGYNQLRGPLPNDLVNITTPYPSLKELNLNNNRINGVIPSDFFGPKKLPAFNPRPGLMVFNLRYNLLEGGVPTNVKNMYKLTTFLVNDNKMDGSIDSSLDEFLLKLKYCDVSDNVHWDCPISDAVAEKCRAWCK
eukprot:TRINITY_DN11173_c0_g1_i1.p1 TRINITY_DN11173_c0_g1~~TRINITY_DN11173_c0_g1_i1.p1  ORF type:complete len:251 (-),score=57.59 TRINITY_DN11173_c0_g1_i1:566-1318(-)